MKELAGNPIKVGWMNQALEESQSKVYGFKSAYDEVADNIGNDDSVGLGVLANTRSHLNHAPQEIVVVLDRLTSMDADAHSKVFGAIMIEHIKRLLDGTGAGDRRRGVSKRSHHPIAGAFYLSPASILQRSPDDNIMFVHHSDRLCIAKPGSHACEIDDVGEQHRAEGGGGGFPIGSRWHRVGNAVEKRRHRGEIKRPYVGCHATMCILVDAHRRFQVRRVNQAEVCAGRSIGPVAQESDTAMILHFQVLPTLFHDVVRRPFAKTSIVSR